MQSDLDWPLVGSQNCDATALLVIDMQVDFVGPGGWFDQIGVSIEPSRRAIAPLARLMQTFRQRGITLIHTRESYRKGGWDIAGNAKWRSGNSGLAYGSLGKSGSVLTRGEAGWQIIPELAPSPDEWVIDKPGKSAFWGTDLDSGLRAQGITNLVISGVTTDVCVQTTLRDACDLGYDCILATDACAASKTQNHEDYLELLSTLPCSVAPMASVDSIIEKTKSFQK